MKKLEGENFHVEGSPTESKLTGVVSGEIEGKEWTSTEDASAKTERLGIERKEEEHERKILNTLSTLAEAHKSSENIVACFESASSISDTNERLSTTIANLLDLSNALLRAQREHDENIEMESERRRIELIVNHLRKL